ncbi:MAG TPA: hypothetical protein PK385_08295 [Spirochaetota bacterium]|nr:hypothetical protein [Spirochaetota bacterium]HOS32635.1 hypothetical protein [Spirochaetota bacterium]HOS56044.1 hypothetical protein [Spirochaetota bacterium]HPK61022.1 hypothetical protein [Spirochaetota bacterium]HQF78500.1 hypothetical protein [Spirochaetota bacterium]
MKFLLFDDLIAVFERIAGDQASGSWGLTHMCQIFIRKRRGGYITPYASNFHQGAAHIAPYVSK